MIHLRHKTNKRIYKYVYFKTFIWNLTFHICKLFWRSMQYMRGGRHLLAHPPSQDILTPEHHILIKTADSAVSTVREDCKRSGIQRDARQTSSQHATGCRNCRKGQKYSVVRIYNYARARVCVCGNLHPYHHISFKEHLPEDGSNRSLKHVVGYAVYTTINLYIFICTCWSSHNDFGAFVSALSAPTSYC